MKTHLLTTLIKPLALAGNLVFASGFGATSALAASDNSNSCAGLPSHSQLRSILQSVVKGGGNGGLGNDMWGTVVNRDGVVCGVVFTGADRGAQWLGSRVISAQKANTANAFSRPSGVIGFAGALPRRTCLPPSSRAEVFSVYSIAIRSTPKPRIKETQQVSANPTIPWSVKKSEASMYSAAASRSTTAPEISSAVWA